VLLLTVVGTFLVWWSGNRAQDAIQSAANAQVVKVEAEARENVARVEADAKGRIAEASQKAAEAAQKAAEANQKASEANERATKAASSLALAEQHAADANAKAERFRLDIAQANERAAEANRIAEQERLARLQLEARLADRVLLPTQEQGLRESFARLNGQTVDINILGDTMEISQFSGKIMACMRDAGVLLNVSHPLGGAAARGVLVGVKPDAPQEFKQTATEFITILQQSVGGGVGLWDFDKLSMSGATAMVSSDKGATPSSQSPLRIVIGSK